MSVKLINIPEGDAGGSLWFILNPATQPFVAPWIRANMENLNAWTKERYQEALDESDTEDYTDHVFAMTDTGARFRLYRSFGVWRVGTYNDQRFMQGDAIVEIPLLKALKGS